MKVRFDEISTEGSNLIITDESWFPDSEIERRGKVSASVFLRRDGKRVFMEAAISVTVALACDRCLESFTRKLDDEFQVEFELAEDEGGTPALSEHEVDSAEMDIVYLDEAAVDVYEVLQQQVYLIMPERSLCGDDCRGLCSSCGANLNKEKCRCDSKGSNSPFSVLAGVKIVKE